MKCIPAPLEPDIPAFSAQMHRLLPYFDQYAIDIQDGKFVPTKTARPRDMLEFFSQETTTHNRTFDFDLMTYSFEEDLKDIEKLSQYVHIGVIIIHYGLLKGMPLPKLKNIPIGISLNPQDSVELVARQYDLKFLPVIQIMTIHAGPQGQSFIPKMLNKIGSLRHLDYRNKIYIDGSVNSTTIPLIKSQSFLPDVLCVGSFLTKSGDDLPSRVEYLKSIE